jgi:hypothetical protein
MGPWTWPPLRVELVGGAGIDASEEHRDWQLRYPGFSRLGLKTDLHRFAPTRPIYTERTDFSARDSRDPGPSPAVE